MFLTSKKISHAIWKTIAMALSLSVFGYPIVPALIFGGVMSLGAYSALVCSSKNKSVLLPLLLPVLSYVISFTVTNDPFISLSALIIYIPALILGIATRRGAGMTSAILSCAAALFAITVTLAAFGLYTYYGSISTYAVQIFVGDMTNFVVEYYKQSFELLEVEFTNDIRQVLVLAINTYVNSAVGLAMAICACVAYIAIKLQHRLFSSYGLDEHLSPESTTFTVSSVSAIVFMAAFILSFSLDSFNQISIVGVVCGNLCIALTPAFSIMFFRAIKALNRRMGARGILLSVVLIAFVLLMFAASPMILPLIGAIYIILGAVDTWAKDFYGKGDNK